MRERPVGNETYDVVVVGSGAGGMSTAITAKKHGLSVAIIEKAAVFGGTTAFSGGVLWVPLTHHTRDAGHDDSREAAIRYLKEETGNYFSADMVEAYVDTGPKMVDFFERETEVRFVPTLYPD